MIKEKSSVLLHLGDSVTRAPMYLKPSQIDSLAKYILKQLLKQQLAIFSGREEEASSLIVCIFRANMEEENKLNDDAKKLLDQNKKKLGLSLDEEKALSMIKKQLAKERNFVL